MPGGRQVAVRNVQIQRREYKGPIPDPETLAALNASIPNGADRIMSVAEKDQELKIFSTHKILEIKEKKINHTHKETVYRHSLAAVIAVTAIVAGATTIILSNGAGQWFGGIISAAGIGPALYNLTVRYK
jgi:uncharacterized membrane protein